MADVGVDVRQAMARPTPKPFLGGDVPTNKYIAPQAETKVMALDKFRNVTSGMPETINRNRQRTEYVKSNAAEFSSQLVEGLTGNITSHFDKIARLKKQEIADPAHPGQTIRVYDLIRREGQGTQDPLLAIEDTMFALISNEDGSIDPNKVSDLLDDPRFIEASMRIMAQKKRRILESLGMRANVLPEGQRPNLRDVGRTITLDPGRGNINTAVRDIGHWLGADALRADRDSGWPNWGTVAAGGVAGVAGGVVGGALGSALGPLGTVGGAAAGVAVGEGIAAAVGGIVQSSFPGLRVRFERSTNILETAQTTQNNRDLYLYGIDPSDFEMNAHGHLVPNHSRAAVGERMRTTNLPEALREALQIQSMQAMYAEALKVDPCVMEDETQYIYNPSADWRRGSAPQTGEYMVADINNEYSRLLLEARADPHFAENYIVLHNLYTRAESLIIQRRLESIITDKSSAPDSRRAGRLGEKLQSLQEGSAGFNTRIEGFQRTLTRARGDKRLVDGDTPKLTAYQTELNTLRTQRQDVQKTLGTISVNGGANPADIPAAIAAIQGILQVNNADTIVGISDENGTDLGAVQSILRQQAEAKRTRDDAVADADTRFPPTLVRGVSQEDPRAKTLKDLAISDYQRDLASIEAKRNALTETITKLQTLQTTTQTAERTIDTNPASQDGTRMLQQFGDDHRRLLAFGVTPAQLDAGDIGAILATINTAAAGGTPDAWAENQNNLDQRRSLVLHAIIEQRALTTLAANPDAARLTGLYDRATNGGVTANQLRYLSPQGLADLYNNRALATQAERMRETAAAVATLHATRGEVAAALTARTAARALPPGPARGAAINAARARVRAARAAETAAIAQEAAARAAEATATARVAMPMTAVEMTSAQQWAQEILNARIVASTNESSAIGRDIEGFQLQIDATGAALEPAREQVRSAETVLQGWEGAETQSRETATMFTTEGRGRLVDTTHPPTAVTRANGYSQAEIDSGKTVAELELLQILTGYQNNPDREREFNRFATLLTRADNIQALFESITPYVPQNRAAVLPDPLTGTPGRAQFIWGGTTFTPPGGGPTITPPIPGNIIELMDMLRPVIEDRSFAADAMYRSLGLFVNRLYQQAMSV